jgi:pilus assembly protein CpaE
VLPADPVPTEPAQLLARLGHGTLPDVLVLDATRNVDAVLALAARFDGELPGTGVVLIGNPDTLALPAMRAGVRDVISPEVDTNGIAEALAAVAQSVQLHRASADLATGPLLMQQAPGRVVTVLSPKGGAGKTTVAANLAIGLAEAMPGGVALVDLDVQFGDVATALSLDPEFTLDDVVHGAALRDPIALKTQLTRHASGLSVVCAPDNPVAADGITPDQVSALLRSLATQFRYVVVDTAAGLEPRTLAALDHTTDPILLSTFDVPGARGLRKEIDTLRELGMLTAARQIVLNFANPKAGLSLEDVEATIRSKVDMAMPHSAAVTVAMNTGVPLVQQRPRDPVAKQLRKLLTRYASATPSAANGRHRTRS